MNGHQHAAAAIVAADEFTALCVLVGLAETLIQEDHTLDQGKEEGSPTRQPQRPQTRLLQQGPQ